MAFNISIAVILIFFSSKPSLVLKCVWVRAGLAINLSLDCSFLSLTPKFLGKLSATTLRDCPQERGYSILFDNFICKYNILWFNPHILSLTSALFLWTVSSSQLILLFLSWFIFAPLNLVRVSYISVGEGLFAEARINSSSDTRLKKGFFPPTVAIPCQLASVKAKASGMPPMKT